MIRKQLGLQKVLYWAFWGELVHAEIILNEGANATEHDITEHSKKLIANYKCPKSIKFRTKPLPISGAGKLYVQRFLLASF